MPAHNAWTREHIDMVFPAHLVKHLPHEWRTCNGQQDSVNIQFCQSSCDLCNNDVECECATMLVRQIGIAGPACSRSLCYSPAVNRTQGPPVKAC